MGTVKKSSLTPGSLSAVSVQWDLAGLSVLGAPVSALALPVTCGPPAPSPPGERLACSWPSWPALPSEAPGPHALAPWGGRGLCDLGVAEHDPRTGESCVTWRQLGLEQRFGSTLPPR